MDLSIPAFNFFYFCFTYLKPWHMCALIRNVTLSQWVDASVMKREPSFPHVMPLNLACGGMAAPERGHESGLNRVRNVEILQYLPDHSGIKWKVHTRRESGEFTHMWKSRNTLKPTMSQCRNRKGLRKYFKTNENSTMQRKQ